MISSSTTTFEIDEKRRPCVIEMATENKPILSGTVAVAVAYNESFRIGATKRVSITHFEENYYILRVTRAHSLHELVMCEATNTYNLFVFLMCVCFFNLVKIVSHFEFHL